MLMVPVDDMALAMAAFVIISIDFDEFSAAVGAG